MFPKSLGSWSMLVPVATANAWLAEASSPVINCEGEPRFWTGFKQWIPRQSQSNSHNMRRIRWQTPQRNRHHLWTFRSVVLHALPHAVFSMSSMACTLTFSRRKYPTDRLWIALPLFWYLQRFSCNLCWTRIHHICQAVTNPTSNDVGHHYKRQWMLAGTPVWVVGPLCKMELARETSFDAISACADNKLFNSLWICNKLAESISVKAVVQCLQNPGK